ncbi:hypothetical protein Q2941_33515 [Bradyrhizobium sp. UFLA05-153]
MSGARHRQKGDRVERKLAEQVRLLRDWLVWRRDERKAVLAGQHGAMLGRLLYILKNLALNSATLLVVFVRGIDWTAIHASTRLINLHEIDSAIAALRIRYGLAPFDDGWLGSRESAVVTIRQTQFPAQAAPPGAQPGLGEQGDPLKHKDSADVE